jgi:hypothetical protein
MIRINTVEISLPNVYNEQTNAHLNDSLLYRFYMFFRAFSSVVRQMPGSNSQRRGTARTLPGQLIVLFCVLFVSIVLFYVLLVCKCVLYYCHRVST